MTSDSQTADQIQTDATSIEGVLTTKASREQLAQWVEEYGDYLFRYARKYFRSDDHAADLVQETFLAATRGIEKFGGKSAPKTWLTGILRHKIFDRMKARKKDEKIVPEPAEDILMNKLFDDHEHWTIPHGPVFWSKDPEEVLEKKEFFKSLQKCLDALPERIRQIFLLREMDGLDRDEISMQFDLSANNIGVILHRARLSLQACLQTNWFRGGEKI